VGIALLDDRDEPPHDECEPDESGDGQEHGTPANRRPRHRQRDERRSRECPTKQQAHEVAAPRGRSERARCERRHRAKRDGGEGQHDDDSLLWAERLRGRQRKDSAVGGDDPQGAIREGRARA
jgi:hypothetical protein